MTRIILIGFMGAGKTTLGKVVARELGLDFYDLDRYIEDRFHQSLPDIFATRGEAGFRETERRMLREVAEFEDVVIACGGGTPCFADNMEYMNMQGDTVFIDADPATLQTHIGMGKTVRPLVQGKSPEELRAYIAETLRMRLPYYTQARHTIKIGVMHTREQIRGYALDIIQSVKANNNRNL